MPVRLLARLAGGFDHRVVVVDAHVAAAAQAAGSLGQARMKGDFLGVWIVGPEIDHLVEDALVLFRHAANPSRPL